MRKLKTFFLLLSILLILTIFVFYLFIPSTIKISEVTATNCPANAAVRHLNNITEWAKWWPNSSEKNGSYSYNGYSFTPHRGLLNTLAVDVKKGFDTLDSYLSIMPAGRDSVLITWQGVKRSSINPFERFANYDDAESISATIARLLSDLKSFLGKAENVYGSKITETTVKDTLLFSAKQTLRRYPSTSDIYSLISKIRMEIEKQNAGETGYPMLNISRSDSSYVLYVAIPVNKVMSNADGCKFKIMIPGNILVTEVKGGEKTTDEALKQLSNYVNDRSLQTPAIPFASLVTERNKEPDTSKWITKVYYPIL